MRHVGLTGRKRTEGTGRIGGLAETTDIREGMGVIAETMGIHPTSHTPNIDRGAGKKLIGTEVGQCEHVLLGAGEGDGTKWVDGGGVEKYGLINKKNIEFEHKQM